MKVKFKRIAKDAMEPSRGSDQAAGYDLYAHIDTGEEIIEPGNTTKIGTGISLEIPEGYFGAVFARSGLAAKEGLRPANCVGVIDSDYRGEIIVALHNDNIDHEKTVKSGERIAQIVIMPYLQVKFEEADLNNTNRGSNGFGSTGD